jgi:hypothetical protein
MIAQRILSHFEGNAYNSVILDGDDSKIGSDFSFLSYGSKSATMLFEWQTSKFQLNRASWISWLSFIVPNAFTSNESFKRLPMGESMREKS